MTTTPVLPENAPFDTGQRAWINGYLAGLLQNGAGAAADTPAAPVAQPEGPELTVMFGTQTGTTETLAHAFASKAKERGMKPRVVDMSEFVSVDLSKTDHLFVLTSTYGEGDMPDNAQGFWDALASDDAPKLESTRFSVLALGDTNYEEFCEAGKKFDKRLEELGASRLHPRTDCDVDYEESADIWMHDVLEEIAKLVHAAANGNGTANGATNGVAALMSNGAGAATKPKARFDKKNPFVAKLLTNRVLTAEGSAKETRHYEICLKDSGLSYEVGDALGVIPTNCPELVSAVLGAAGLPGNDVQRKALTETNDITKPSKAFLTAVAERDESGKLAELLKPENKTALGDYLWGRELIDVLTEYKPDFSAKEFFSLLKPIQPRLYSISSSLKACPEQVHLTVASIRYESQGRSRKGVCSTFLADRAADGVPIFIQPSHGFRLPQDKGTSVIMVGPGTGVAPFRAFLQERVATAATGKNWLFFGEQRAATDFFYREELDQWMADGLLTRRDTAFSRDQKHKVYVQHRMLEAGEELWAWLQEGAFFYVCGDASRMAKDVDAALHQIAAEHGGLSETDAAAYIATLKKDKRYLRDVY